MHELMHVAGKVSIIFHWNYNISIIKLPSKIISIFTKFYQFIRIKVFDINAHDVIKILCVEESWTVDDKTNSNCNKIGNDQIKKIMSEAILKKV